MKNKHILFRPSQRRAFALPLAFTLALAGAAHAATIYWDNTGGTANSWNPVANWSTVVGGGTDPGANPGASDVATFSATPIQGTNQTVNFNANDRSVLGLDVLSGVTANTTLAGGNASTRTLTIGSSGIANAGSGTVNIGSTSGGNASVGVIFSGSQSIANNGTGKIMINNAVTGTSSPTLTNNGTGTGMVEFVYSASINSTVSNIVQDSATSTLALRSNNSASFAGGIVIKKGTLKIGNNTNLGTGASTLTLGNSVGGSDAATLETWDNGDQTFTKAISLASTTTGLLKVSLLDSAGGVPTHTFTGGVTGNNSLTLENNGGDDKLTFSTGAINNTGTLTHIGTGSGDATINSVIGTNVTGVTQNSATSKMVLTGTNTYSGPTTVQAGTLALSSTGLIANTSTIDVRSGATFDVSAVSGYTVGASQTLKGNGTIKGATTINGTLAPGASPGILTQDGGSMQLGVGGDDNWQILDATGVAGTGYDTTNLINGATLDLSLLSAGNTFNINLWSLSSIGPDVNGDATNFNNANSYSWTLFSTGTAISGFSTDKFTINTGAFNGTSGFSNALGGGAFSVGLADGNTDLVLNFTPIPEPRAALLGGLGMLALLRRRR
jgi:autotransporter-associated beta strand protein